MKEMYLKWNCLFSSGHVYRQGWSTAWGTLLRAYCSELKLSLRLSVLCTSLSVQREKCPGVWTVLLFVSLEYNEYTVYTIVTFASMDPRICPSVEFQQREVLKTCKSTFPHQHSEQKAEQRFLFFWPSAPWQNMSCWKICWYEPHWSFSLIICV